MIGLDDPLPALYISRSLLLRAGDQLRKLTLIDLFQTLSLIGVLLSESSLGVTDSKVLHIHLIDPVVSAEDSVHVDGTAETLRTS